MDLRITLLTDHRASHPYLLTEHGLCFLVEIGEHRILFDTGASDVFARNAETLGLPWRTVGHIVLSHGHRDHTGGLGHAMAGAPEAQVYLHPRSLAPRFVLHPGQPAKPLGLPPEAWASLCPVMHHVNWTTAPMRILPQVGITGPIPRKHAFEHASGSFFLDAEGLTPDPFEDEQALWMVTTRGLVVLLGCAHAGVVNTLEHAMTVTGERRIHMVLGGMHLAKAAPERLAFTVEALDRMGVEHVFACHCTGDDAIAILEATLGTRVAPMAAGDGIRQERAFAR